MPQMAPTWWTILYITFIMSFLIMFFLLYFQTYKLPELMNKKNTTQKKLNWKW